MFALRAVCHLISHEHVAFDTAGLFGVLTAVYGWFLSTKKLPEFEHSTAGAV